MSANPAKAAAVCLLAAGVTLGGCSANSSREMAGGIGAVAGGVLGAVLGNNSGMGTAGGAAIGAVAGFIAGSLIGQLLDDADQAKLENASQRSLTQGETIRWNSDRNPGVHGYSEVVSSAETPARGSSGAKPAKGSDAACRTVREVAYVDGKEYVDMAEYCRAEGAAGWTRKTA